jgi:hypothetical protein
LPGLEDGGPIVKVDQEAAGISVEQLGSRSYERPELVAIGNLHDLLAGDGGTQCDNAIVGGTATGGQDNGAVPNC